MVWVKINADTINIVGKWIGIYQKTPKGKIIKLTNIDTLEYCANHKIIKHIAGSVESATWTLNQDRSQMYYDDVQIIDPPWTKAPLSMGTITTSTLWSSDYIGLLGRDTLILVFYMGNNIPNPHYTRYYIKEK